MVNDGDGEFPTIGEDGDPSIAYTISIHMENLLDKLKLLNYETEYVDNLKMKLINRHYFIYQTNPGEQFFSFISIAAWLIRKLGKIFEQPQEHDDPNSVITTILEKLKELKYDLECPPNKLKQGCGIHAILVLSFLADLALKKATFLFNRPIIIDKVEEMTEAEGAEIFLDKVEEEMLASFSEDEERENPMEADELQLAAMENLQMLELKRPEKVLEPDNNLDLLAWQAEVERAAPLLKISYNLEMSEWRLHHMDAGACTQEALDHLSVAREQVALLIAEINSDMEKIASKETHTGFRVEKLLNEHKNLKGESSSLKATYESINGGVKERSRILLGINEEIEAIKMEMDERGANMTDGSPLVVMKRALANVKNEIVAMDLRIAVLEHSLLQGRMRKKNQLQREMREAIEN